MFNTEENDRNDGGDDARVNENRAELRRVRKLLRQMYQLAEHSSLTGSLTDGGRDAVEKYNLILRRVEEKGIDLGGLFPPLPEDASFDRLGVAAKLLDGYLAEDADAGGNRDRGTTFQPNIVIGNMEGLDQLKDLGRTIREHLAEALGDIKGKARTDEPAPEPAPQPVPMPDLSRQTVER